MRRDTDKYEIATLSKGKVVVPSIEGRNAAYSAARRLANEYNEIMETLFITNDPLTHYRRRADTIVPDGYVRKPHSMLAAIREYYTGFPRLPREDT